MVVSSVTDAGLSYQGKNVEVSLIIGLQRDLALGKSVLERDLLTVLLQSQAAACFLPEGLLVSQREAFPSPILLV